MEPVAAHVPEETLHDVSVLQYFLSEPSSFHRDPLHLFPLSSACECWTLRPSGTFQPLFGHLALSLLCPSLLHFPLRKVTIGQKLSLISGYTEPIVKPYLYIWLFRIRAVIHAILFIGHCNQINTHLLGSLSSSKALQVLGFLPLVRLRYPARN